MRVLLVDDDEKLTKLLAQLLKKERFVVDVAHDGAQAETRARRNDYDAIVLDLNLPEKDGVEVCASLRKDGFNVPILMLTGRNTIDDRVAGLDAGADDYLAKPFGPTELVARIRALLRRPKQVLPDKLKIADLELDPGSHTVVRAGQMLDLMPKEYALLEFLMRSPNQVKKKEEILANVWGVYSKSSSNRLEVYVRYLRDKVDKGFDKPLIKTVRGAGYKISDE